jgi:hypothetical protein
VLYGTVLRDNSHEVSIKLHSGGLLSFRRSQVRQVRLGATSELRARAEAAESAAPTPPLFRRPGSLGASGAVTPRPPAIDPRSLAPTPEPAPPAASSIAASAPRAAAAGPTSVPTSREPASDPESRFSIVPPAGLLRETTLSDNVAILSFRDPLTQASCVVSRFPADLSLVELKKKVTASYAGVTQNLRVREDSAFAGGDFDGWRVEFESQVGDLALHQMQVFARKDDMVVMVTYSCTAPLWDHYRASFEESATSLRFTAPLPAPEADSPPAASPSPPGPEATTEPLPER